MNFSNITNVIFEQLTNFSGDYISNSKKHFRWKFRPDMIAGNTTMFLPEFVVEMRGRGKLTSWIPQEQILKHHVVGGFLTHSR